jgi:hypothetical protein
MFSRADLKPCRRCNETVRWTTSEAGKTFLVDPSPHPDGNTAVMRDAGGVLRSRRISKNSPALPWERVMMPHAATCKPKASPPPPRPRPAMGLHDVLGVPASASPGEIKSAYRRLARQLHPDINPDPAAAERFKRVTEAYDLLTGRRSR